MITPGPSSSHQLSAFEQPNVLGDGVERHGKGRGQFGDTRFALRQALEDGPTRPVGQRDEDLVQTEVGGGCHDIHL